MFMGLYLILEQQSIYYFTSYEHIHVFENFHRDTFLVTVRLCRQTCPVYYPLLNL